MSIVMNTTVTCTDAEFLLINGAAAPTIPILSPLASVAGVSASSSAGTTTTTLATGFRTSGNVARLANVFRAVQGVYNPNTLTQTY